MNDIKALHVTFAAQHHKYVLNPRYLVTVLTVCLLEGGAFGFTLLLTKTHFFILMVPTPAVFFGGKILTFTFFFCDYIS